jgi:hypothetical protein
MVALSSLRSPADHSTMPTVEITSLSDAVTALMQAAEPVPAPPPVAALPALPELPLPASELPPVELELPLDPAALPAFPARPRPASADGAPALAGEPPVFEAPLEEFASPSGAFDAHPSPTASAEPTSTEGIAFCNCMPMPRHAVELDGGDAARRGSTKRILQIARAQVGARPCNARLFCHGKAKART